MVEQLVIHDDDYYVPDASQLVTEDDTPVDNFGSEKQQRLLVSTLYSAISQNFIAAANVGIYHTDGQPPIVPDVFLSFDVQVPTNWWEKQNRCYMVWRFGKPPELVIEIVSNKEGDELGNKLRIYEQMRVSYYIVYDPSHQLGEQTLRVFELRPRRYFETTETWLEQVELGLTLWQGEFEGRQDTWLRWCHQDGSVLLTGDERTQSERLEKEQAILEKEQAILEKEQALERSQILAERLRAMGIDPNTL
ncbi:Uma2 family endonuclease [Nostoc sp. CHAB 5715]|uniref:Uma2 family endonuclease n=1 Tax=Nostoc sp. CHAB 5715 TaxID=2780400 RepID=UPI001E4BC837|nr:Uma2 family endonuclease [Nostoc sp. CHAB 5715]MCC5623387.1 Uma2 family endonuclease [Nostoc sp. CHAB 5715]